MLVDVLSVAAVVLPVLRSWPQVFRIVRTNSVDGVSPLAWGLMLVNFCVWMTYGVLESLLVLIITNALCALGCAAVLIALVLHRSARPALLVILPVAGVGLSWMLGSFAGNTAVLVAGTALAMTMFVPQVVKVFKEPSLGVSKGTWALSCVGSAVWLGYAAAIGKPWIATPHYVMLPCALVILWRAMSYDYVRAAEITPDPSSTP